MLLSFEMKLYGKCGVTLLSALNVLPIAKLSSRRNTKPTRYWLSLETTTGYPLCSVSFNKFIISSTVIESCVITDSDSLRLRYEREWKQINFIFTIFCVWFICVAKCDSLWLHNIGSECCVSKSLFAQKRIPVQSNVSIVDSLNKKLLTFKIISDSIKFAIRHFEMFSNVYLSAKRITNPLRCHRSCHQWNNIVYATR